MKVPKGMLEANKSRNKIPFNFETPDLANKTPNTIAMGSLCKKMPVSRLELWLWPTTSTPERSMGMPSSKE